MNLNIFLKKITLVWYAEKKALNIPVVGFIIIFLKIYPWVTPERIEIQFDKPGQHR